MNTLLDAGAFRLDKSTGLLLSHRFVSRQLTPSLVDYPRRVGSFQSVSFHFFLTRLTAPHRISTYRPISTGLALPSLSVPSLALPGEKGDE